MQRRGETSIFRCKQHGFPSGFQQVALSLPFLINRKNPSAKSVPGFSTHEGFHDFPLLLLEGVTAQGCHQGDTAPRPALSTHGKHPPPARIPPAAPWVGRMLNQTDLSCLLSQRAEIRQVRHKTLKIPRHLGLTGTCSMGEMARGGSKWPCSLR